MAVSGRLSSRLSKIPGVLPSDIVGWVDESVEESGLDEIEDENAVFYLALAIAYETIASNSAHFFKYSDGDESVDKSNIYANYIKLAKSARKSYRKHVRGRFGASQSHSGRADNR
jgi:hypothetical protein